MIKTQTMTARASEKLSAYSRYLKTRQHEQRAQFNEVAAAEEKLKLQKTPLSPAEWIKNEYFAGKLARDIFDKVRDGFIMIFEYCIFQIFLAGSIGWGKTTLCKLVHAYSLYLLDCYGIPQLHFRGMLEHDQILYLNLNIQKQKAKNSYFKSLKVLLESIPFFMNDFMMQKGMVNEIRFPGKNVMCTFGGATKTSAESENLIFLIMDEANLYDKVKKSKRSDTVDEAYDAAAVVFDSALRRMQSRFMLRDGTMPPPSKLITLCKETHPKSFIRNKIKYIRDRGFDRDKKVLVLEYAEYDTKPHLYDMDDLFWIKTGTRMTSPTLIEDREEADREKRFLADRESLEVTEDQKYEVIDVPRAGGTFVESARTNLLNFIRDVCGRPTEGLNMLFGDKAPIFKAVRKPGQGHVPEVCAHPFSALTTNFYDGVFLMENMIAQIVNGKWRPLINPSAPRFIHVDTGLTGDSAGFAMGHPSGWKQVTRMSSKNLLVYEKAPEIFMDVLLSITPPPGGEIQFEAIRGIVYTLRELGFNIIMITLDSYQSRDFIQIVERKNFEAELVSIDKSTVPYIRVHRAYVEERISTYESPILEDELGSLELVRTGEVRDGRPVEKYDHPSDSSKDLSDAVAGVVDRIEEWAIEMMVTDTIPSMDIEKVKSEGERAMEKQEAFEDGDFEKMWKMVQYEDPDGEY